MIPTQMDHETPSGTASARDARLDDMFRVYRGACETSRRRPNFKPNIWAGIEARDVSTNWFGRFAKTLVATARTASTILGIMIFIGEGVRSVFQLDRRRSVTRERGIDSGAD